MAPPVQDLPEELRAVWERHAYFEVENAHGSDEIRALCEWVVGLAGVTLGDVRKGMRIYGDRAAFDVFQMNEHGRRYTTDDKTVASRPVVVWFR